MSKLIAAELAACFSFGVVTSAVVHPCTDCKAAVIRQAPCSPADAGTFVLDGSAVGAAGGK